MSTKAEILLKIQDLLDLESDLLGNEVLSDLPEYDSMAILGLMEWYDSIGVNVQPSDFIEFVTVDDLVKRALQA